MSDAKSSAAKWGVAGGAIATLAIVSPPAAAAAGVAFGLHEAYNWWNDPDKGDKRPEKSQ